MWLFLALGYCCSFSHAGGVSAVPSLLFIHDFLQDVLFRVCSVLFNLLQQRSVFGFSFQTPWSTRPRPCISLVAVIFFFIHHLDLAISNCWHQVESLLPIASLVQLHKFDNAVSDICDPAGILKREHQDVHLGVDLKKIQLAFRSLAEPSSSLTNVISRFNPNFSTPKKRIQKRALISEIELVVRNAFFVWVIHISW